MHYIIQYGNKIFAGKELFMAAHKVGEAAFTRYIANNSEKVTTFFNTSVAIQIDKKEIKLYTAVDTEVQNLSASLQNFELVSPHSNMEGISKYILDAEKHIFYSFDKFEFVRLSNIVLASKYRKAENMPVLQVCGTKYVAVNTINRKAENPIVVVR